MAERLAAKGWVLQPQIGVSGFRIDLASPWASGHAPRQQAEHMIAIDLPVRILFEFLEPEGPSTHGFWLEEFAARYVFRDAEVVVASPAAGQPPVDPKGEEQSWTARRMRDCAYNEAVVGRGHRLRCGFLPGRT